MRNGFAPRIEYSSLLQLLREPLRSNPARERTSHPSAPPFFLRSDFLASAPALAVVRQDYEARYVLRTGPCGGLTASHSRYGQYLRKRPSCKRRRNKPRTADSPERDWRARSALWNSLSGEHRGWEIAADGERSRPAACGAHSLRLPNSGTSGPTLAEQSHPKPGTSPVQAKCKPSARQGQARHMRGTCEVHARCMRGACVVQASKQAGDLEAIRCVGSVLGGRLNFLE
jgi:hypothetical protein